MSVKPGIKRTQGKGDAWRVKHSTFREAMSQIKTGHHDSSGKVFLKKHNRTILKYV